MRMSFTKALNILEEVSMMDDSIYAYSKDYNEALETVIEESKWRPVIVEKDLDGEYTYKCEMPSDAEEILVTIMNFNKSTKKSTYYVDSTICYCEKLENGNMWYYTDENYDWYEDIVAWKPLPEPFKHE